MSFLEEDSKRTCALDKSFLSSGTVSDALPLCEGAFMLPLLATESRYKIGLLISPLSEMNNAKEQARAVRTVLPRNATTRHLPEMQRL